MAVIKGNGITMTLASTIASQHFKLIEYTNKQMSDAMMLPASAIDYVPGTLSFEPISITRTIAKEDVDKLFNMLERELLGVHRGMKRPDSEWFDE